MARLPVFRVPGIAGLAWPKRLGLSDRRAERAGLIAAALLKINRDQLRAEWAGSPPHRWLISKPRPEGLGAAPVELRPPRLRRGKAMVGGRFVFDGLVLEAGPGGDPWNRPSPSRAFADELHAMDWLPDLLAVDGGAAAALNLVQGWAAVFGRWNSFSWSGLALERRVHNLACALKALTAADPSGGGPLQDSLARQARHLLLGGDATRRVERAAAAALAGTALGGQAGEKLMAQGLKRLAGALPTTVLPDGGHASRSPEAALELLLDLKILDEALAQRGRPAPEELSRAIDRLTGAVRRLTLADGKLAALQGGEESDPARIDAALGPPPEGGPPRQTHVASQIVSLPHTGYEFLTGAKLQAVVDTGAPARGPWSIAACAQPLAMEVTAGTDRLITSSAWSPRAPTAQALRLTPAASTASISDLSCGHPLQGRLAKILGYRLEGAGMGTRYRRHDAEVASWLELSHDGWENAFGLIHERRLYLDRKADELRGEDLLSPAEGGPKPQRRPVVLVVRFQLHPEVKASLALDHKSVLLQPRGAKTAGGGWWLRNDAPEVSLEPSVRLEAGRPHHGSQVVLRALLGRDGNARIRWKLSQADKGPDKVSTAESKAAAPKAGKA
jgi:uncharacterized heparinase superfamily protein